jgi:hypothetical protein
LWVFAVLLVILIAVLFPRIKNAFSTDVNSPGTTKAGQRPESITLHPRRFRTIAERRASGPAKTAEEIVTGKVRQFGQKRRAIAERIANRLNKDLPPEIDAFFKAIDKGDWDEIHSRFVELATHAHQYDYSKGDRPDLDPYWGTVLDTFGVAEQAHNWPAQQLLDYGNTILGSLQPGMVYVGGTDDGRFVPELLNETSGDSRIMLTQNALADPTYLDYLRELYGDQFNMLTPDDSQLAFQQYITDAQKRLQHDLNFPDEPKQVLPGENIQVDANGHVQVSGQVAVMSVNQVLLQMLMQKNPDMSFAMQESFPMQNTYPGALPLGPLLELNAQNAQNQFTTDVAAQSVDYWSSMTQTLLADPNVTGSSTTLKSYSHDVNATANLLAANNFTDQAEQAYTLASQIYPGNPDPVNGLAKLLTQTGHADQAQALVSQFLSKYPDQRSAVQQPPMTITGNLAPPVN